MRIAVCAPSGPLRAEDAARVAQIAAEFPGLELAFHDQCFAREGHFAGSDAVRLAALVACANDPGIDGVWFARGGYGANRIAEAAIAQFGVAARTKRYLGYSDAGYLLAGIYRAGISQPVHAPMPTDIRRADGTQAVRRVLGYLSGDSAGLEPTLDAHPAAAFNLMTLAMLTGTPLMPDLTGHVVMVEEVSEHLYAVDRLFYHVTQHLRGVAGLRLGRVSDVPDNDVAFGSEPEEIARFWCARHGIAYLGRADIGHDAANRVVPFGLAGRGAA